MGEATDLPWFAQPADLLVGATPAANGYGSHAAGRGRVRSRAAAAVRAVEVGPSRGEDRDWPVARQLAERVSDGLAGETKARAAAGGGLVDEATRREFGRSLIERVLREWVHERAEAGDRPSTAGEEWLRQAIFWTVFGLGPLEPLLADEQVENIIVVGQRVQLQYADGSLVDAPALADSDAGLVELLNRAGTVFGSAERTLSPSSPHFRMSLPNGSRLSAVAYVTPAPQAAIRRHRTSTWTLSDFVDRSMISPSLRQFLLAVLRARKNILVVGPQDAGKTSLLRALLRELPPQERPATIESEYELRLHDHPSAHPWVLPMEARPGSRESTGGDPVGRVTLTDLVQMSLGQATTRLVVGEVLGGEVLPMLNAMMAGSQGSMCTIHARSARNAFQRMAVLCTQAQPNLLAANAYQLSAVAVDYVVVVNAIDERAVGGRKHRFVSEVAHVLDDLGEGGLPALDMVYRPDADGRAMPVGLMSGLLELVRVGFDPAWLTEVRGGWAAPLDLRIT